MTQLTQQAPSPWKQIARKARGLGARQIAEKLLSVARSRWRTRRCTSVGLWVRVDGKLLVNNGGEIHLGEQVRIRGTHVPVELGSLPGGRLRIGARTFINGGTSICAAQQVDIGCNCAIGNYTLIMDSDFHSVGDHGQAGKCQPVIIEDDVWIAARVTILKGVRIGKGAVVAAGAVVTRDVPPGAVVGGIPARSLRGVKEG